MRGSVRSSRMFSLAGAVAGLWLCGAGSAWAGGGGKDAGVVQPTLDAICGFLGMTSCPQLPTVTQIILEVSALQNTPPGFVRSPFYALQFSVPACTVAGNLGFPACTQNNAVDAVNPPNPPVGSHSGPLATSPMALASLSNPTPLASSPIAVSNLSSLTPLPFISPLNGAGNAVPVPLGTKGANSFFYAVTTGANGQPDTLDLFYDYPSLTNPNFAKGQVVAKISLPLEVLNADGSERLVCGTQNCSPPSVATLQISANCNGGPGCLTANVMGDFSVPGTLNTPSPSAADLGLQFGLVFGSSPNATQPHAIFEVQVPLLVTGPTSPTNCGAAITVGTPDPADCGNDPAYFGIIPPAVADPTTTGSPTGINQLSGLPTAFKTDDLGFTPKFLGLPVGIAPFAAPPCPGGALCSSPPPQSTFPFCASFWANGTSPPIHSAVAAFLAIGTDGTAYVSSPIPPVVGAQCPF